jgi:3-methylcrotonyl-CoA carboxylase beta subunit
MPLSDPSRTAYGAPRRRVARAPRACGAGAGEPREASRRRHVARGKLLARDRIDALLDRGSPFLEIAPLAACDLGDEWPSAGVVAGIGLVHGRHVMIVANDATVKGGTYHPLTVKKHLRAQEIAAENRLLRLPRRLGRRVPADAGRGVPRPRSLRPHLLQPGTDVARRHPADRRRAVIVDRRPAPHVPAMSDDGDRPNQGRSPRRPSLVKAATGEVVSAEARRRDTTRASPASPTTSPTTTRTRPDRPRHRRGRSLRPRLPSRAPASPSPPPHAPRRSRDAVDVVPVELTVPYDAREIIARIVDDSAFTEFKRGYGETLVTGFARIHGHRVGISRTTACSSASRL